MLFGFLFGLRFRGRFVRRCLCRRTRLSRPRMASMVRCYRQAADDSDSGLAVVGGGLRSAGAGRHFQNHLLLVAKIDRGEMRILLAPLRDVRLVALIAGEELVVAEVGENVGALLGHQHARVFGIGEVDFGDLLGKALPGAVEFADEAPVDRHARLARCQRIAADRCR